MRDIRRLLRYLGPYRKDMVTGAFLVLAETCLELFIPVLIADLIDVGVAGHDISYILSKGLQMGVCAVLALITGLLYARFAARAAYGWYNVQLFLCHWLPLLLFHVHHLTSAWLHKSCKE